MGLKALKVLVAKKEPTPGTFDATVYASTYGQHLIDEDASMEFQPTRVERRFARSTFTPLEGLAGRKDASCRFSLEISGETSSPKSGPPPWGVFLEGCGMKQAPLAEMTPGTITGGPLRHGETITQATSGAKAKVVLDTANGATVLYVADIVGVFDTTNVCTGAKSAATFTPSAVPVVTRPAAGVLSVISGNKIDRSTGSWVTDGYAVGDWICVFGFRDPANVGLFRVKTIGGTGNRELEVYQTLAVESSPAGVVVQVAQVNTGTAWWPVTFDTVKVGYTTEPSPALAVGDVFKGATSGATATVVEVDSNSKIITARIGNAKMFTEGENLARVVPDTDSMGTAEAVTIGDMPTLSMALYEDGIRKSARGMRGTVNFELTSGDVPRMSFEFQGSHHVAGSTNKGVDDAPLLTGIAPPLKKPALFLGSACQLAVEGVASTYTPRFRTVRFSLGHDVQFREDAAQTSGVLEGRIVGRAGTGSIDPEIDLEASFPAFDAFLESKPATLRVPWGSAAGNKFVLFAPGALFSGISSGERNRIATSETNFELTGGHYSNASDVPGEDNDLVLVYLN